MNMNPDHAPEPATDRESLPARTTATTGPLPLPPAFGGPLGDSVAELRQILRQAIEGWLQKSMSAHTHRAYRRDLAQFMEFAGYPAGHYEELVRTLPEHVIAWRDSL